jgi:hypothetical protein
LPLKNVYFTLAAKSMKTKHWISLFCLLTLTILGVHLHIKADLTNESLLFFLLLLLTPLVISFIASLFRKKLFHPFFWSVTALILILRFVLSNLPEQFENRFQKENHIAQEHFSKMAGFFTAFSPLLTFNQNIDSGKNANDLIIKCLFRVGRKGIASNYYLGKVKIENDKVVNEYYRQRIIDDKEFAKKEFNSSIWMIIKEQELVKDLIDKGSLK